MPTMKIQWWLWNQMFQYALGFMLSKKYKEELVFDPSYLENRCIFANWTYRNFELEAFGIKKTYILPNFIWRKFIHPRFIEIFRSFQFGERYIREKWGTYISYFPKNAYIDGWFNSYLYFIEYDEAIKILFTVKTPLTLKNKNLLENIHSSSNNAVSLHVRRGDYITLDSANKWHWVSSIEYYEKAIAFMINTLQKPKFFVFSDDISWCKENIHFPDGIEHLYVDHNGSAGHEDLRLMYSCDHHIIANSSFSWWWAYLGKNPNKTIIAPEKWLQIDSFNTRNLIPPSWILL